MHPKLLIALVAGLFLLAGCASDPSFGEQVRADGQSRVDIADQWDQGQRETARGEKLVRSGEKKIKAGRKDLRRGERLVATGNRQVREHRTAYQRLAALGEGAASADAASNRSGRLETIAREWRAGEQRIADGNKRIRRANDRISEGEQEVRQGRKLIENGRSRMRRAENRYEARS